MRQVDDGHDLFLINPAPRDRRADVRLVLVVGEDDLGLETFRFPGEILRRHLGSDERALAGLIGKRTGKVAQYPDLDLVVRNLRRGDTAEGHEGRKGRRPDQMSHRTLPLIRRSGRSENKYYDFYVEAHIV